MTLPKVVVLDLARALYETHAKRQWGDREPWPGWDEFSEEGRARWVELAEAAIERLEMVQAVDYIQQTLDTIAEQGMRQLREEMTSMQHGLDLAARRYGEAEIRDACIKVLHRPIVTADDQAFCHECGPAKAWPCATVRLLGAAPRIQGRDIDWLKFVEGITDDEEVHAVASVVMAAEANERRVINDGC